MAHNQKKLLLREQLRSLLCIILGETTHRTTKSAYRNTLYYSNTNATKCTVAIIAEKDA